MPPNQIRRKVHTEALARYFYEVSFFVLFQLARVNDPQKKNPENSLLLIVGMYLDLKKAVYGQSP
tara:strand:+ start:433 stop:627 length:195 start_codon:yes stop_codon:yes gene_type:complete